VTHRMVRVSNRSYPTPSRSASGSSPWPPRRGDARPTLVLDNARYPRCALVPETAESLGIELLFLPSDSPNLNRIERVWKFVQKESLARDSLAPFEAFTEAIDGCRDRLSAEYKDQMDTLLTHRFQTFDDVPVLSA
jgi:hypothetical protein